MKHLHKFFNYIVESVGSGEIDIDDIKDMTLPIIDLGVDVRYKPKYSSNAPELVSVRNSGIVYDILLYFEIQLDRLSSKVAFDGGDQYRMPLITDTKYWELMSEILDFKNKISSMGLECFVNFQHVWDGSDYKLTLYIVKTKE